MADWAVWQADDLSNDDEGNSAEPADVDESMEARRLSRWLKGMFGGAPQRDDADDEPA
jgi:hypothetical protein